MIPSDDSVSFCERVVVKDRQQEVRAVLVASRYIGDYHMLLQILLMYYIPLFTTRMPAVPDVFDSGRNVGALRLARRVGFR